MPVSLANLGSLLLPGLRQISAATTRTSMGYTRDLLLPALHMLSGELGVKLDLRVAHSDNCIELLVHKDNKIYVRHDFITRYEIEDNTYIQGFRERVVSAMEHLPGHKDQELKPTFSLTELEEAQSVIDELKCKAS